MLLTKTRKVLVFSSLVVILKLWLPSEILKKVEETLVPIDPILTKHDFINIPGNINLKNYIKIGSLVDKLQATYR